MRILILSLCLALVAVGNEVHGGPEDELKKAGKKLEDTGKSISDSVKEGADKVREEISDPKGKEGQIPPVIPHTPPPKPPKEN